MENTMAVTYDDKSALRMETGGSIVEAAGGLAVVVLTIISLAEAAPSTVLSSIAVIVLGIAFLAEGGAIAAELSRLLGVGSGTLDKLDLGGGMTLELLGGVGILALGILSVVGLVSAVLIPAAVITAGAVLVLSSGTLIEINQYRLNSQDTAQAYRGLAQASVFGAVTIEVLAGAAAIVLGILAFTGTAPLLFSEIGLLVCGSALLIGAGTFTASLVRMFGH
jgi:hypothetical protein